MTVSCLKCDRWALASHSPLAKRCWDTFRDTPTHGTQAEGSSWWALTAWKWNSLLSAGRTQCAEICMCERKCVPPSYAAWILNNIVLSLFSPFARLVLQKSLCAHISFQFFDILSRSVTYSCLLCLDDCSPFSYHIKQKAKTARKKTQFVKRRLKCRPCRGSTWSVWDQSMDWLDGLALHFFLQSVRAL